MPHCISVSGFLCIKIHQNVMPTAEGASIDFVCHGSEKNPNFVFYGLADSDTLTLTCASGEFLEVTMVARWL